MPQHKYIPWESVELEELSSLLKRQMIVGDQVMLARVLLKKGCVVPRHSHHNEQVTYILDGALKFVLNGEEVVVRTGEVLCIPSNVPHAARALEDTIDLDIFSPVRWDWVDGTDAYIRSGNQ